MRNVIVNEGQSLLDLALQELGSIEAVFDLADANNLTITDEPTAGQILVVPASSAAQTPLANYYAGTGYRVNTGEVPATPPAPRPGDYSAADYSSDYLTT